jgi:hypothetical protein
MGFVEVPITFTAEGGLRVNGCPNLIRGRLDSLGPEQPAQAP